MSIRHRFISGLKWSALGKTLSQAFSWVITIFVIRLLAPSEYGLMAIAMMVISFLTHLNEFGLGSALVQAQDIDDEQCGAVFGVMLIIACTFASILALSSPLFAWFFDEPRLSMVIAVAGIGFIVTALATIPESMLRREMNFKALAIADMFFVFSGSLVTLAMAWQDFGVWALVIGNLFGATIKTITLHILSPRKIIPNLQFSRCRTFLGFGGYLTASRFAWLTMTQSDVLIGAKIFGKEALGFYSVALDLASLPMNKAMSVINQVTFSAISKMQDQNAATRSGLLEGFKWLAYIVFPAVAGMAVTAPEFVPIILGKNWIGVTIPLQLMAISIPIRMINSVLSTTVVALGRADIDFRNAITGLLIMPTCFVIGAQFGPVGLAGAWLVAIPLIFMINFPRSARVIGISASDLFKVFRLPLLATLLMILSVFSARYFLKEHIDGILLLCALVLTGIAIYIISMSIFDNKFRALLYQLIYRKKHLSEHPPIN